jgi:hypothetical protein
MDHARNLQRTRCGGLSSTSVSRVLGDKVARAFCRSAREFFHSATGSEARVWAGANPNFSPDQLTASCGHHSRTAVWNSISVKRSWRASGRKNRNDRRLAFGPSVTTANKIKSSKVEQIGPGKAKQPGPSQPFYSVTVYVSALLAVPPAVVTGLRRFLLRRNIGRHFGSRFHAERRGFHSTEGNRGSAS